MTDASKCPFKVGDVVRLKSGGPNMTVTSCGDHWSTGPNGVFCTWFAGTKQESGVFKMEVLALVPPDREEEAEGDWQTT
jgi:uncharacterized protein YodC (DUF2158 family)